MAVLKIPNPQWDGHTPEKEYLPISQIGVRQFPDAPEDGKMYNRKSGKWVECLAHPITTLESVPGENTLTYTIEGVTYTFCIGDEARYYDTEKKEYVFYKLYDLKKDKADWKIAGSGGGLANETLILSLTSNQGSDAKLEGVKIHIKYLNNTTTLTWGGVPLTASIPVNVNYTIECEAIEGYKTPDVQEFTAIAGNTRIINSEYQTTLTTITVTSNQSDELSSLTVTVNFDSEDHQLQFNGKETKSINVPTGSKFTITFPEISNYTKPSVISDIAAGASMSKSGEYKSTKLTVTRASNQSEGLGNTTATIGYNSSSTPVPFADGDTSKTLMIPFGVSYNITFSEVTGYKTPDAISGTANSASKNETGTYQSEFLTVNVSGASGYTITVSGQGSQTTSPKVYKIPFGTSYNISASNIKGYNTPATQSFTANQVSRSVTMTYTKIANGVYICDSDGKLTAVGSWNTNNNSKAVGVAVVSDKCSFIIDKKNSTSSIQWGKSGTDVPGLSNITDSTKARLDYDGNSNTDKIISTLGSIEGIAAGWCRSKSINIGGKNRKGYLPALGEWQTAYNNKSQVDSALSKIGGTAMFADYHWASTEFSSDTAWLLRWDSGNVFSLDKYDASYCRPWYVL